MVRTDIGIDSTLFEKLSLAYKRKWGVALAYADVSGKILLRPSGWKQDDPVMGPQVRRLAIEEALRWGEPEVESGPGDGLTWAAPVMHNARTLGALVAMVHEKWLFPADIAQPRIDIRGACADLRRLLEENNLTNAAFLEARRHASIRERERAEAIHAFKSQVQYDIRAAYLIDEPFLLAAIRKGDRGQARALVNRLLVGIIHRAGERFDLAKSFFMELLMTLCRTAVEAGGNPEELLGTNYDSISRLSSIKSYEELAPWLHQMLEKIMDSIHRHRHQSHPALLSKALQYMAEQCCRNISRDEVAEVAFMSPSHFSRFFKKHLGQSFTAVLNQMRIDRSAELLAQGEKDLKIIAVETGFSDQSYFTKVFRKLRGMTPAEYRKRANVGGKL